MFRLGDLRYALRLLLKRPSFSILTVLVIATGIGLSVYLFSYINAMVFRPFPFADSASLVEISGSQNRVRVNESLDLHDYQEIRSSVTGATEFSAYRTTSVNVSGVDGARRYNGVLVEPSVFEVTRTPPALGRSFTEGERLEGAEPVVIVSHELWRTRLGGADSVIDDTLRINGSDHRIVGVMPEGYKFPATAQLWLPLREDARRLPRGEGGRVYGIAHLAEGVSKQDLDAELEVVMGRLAQQYPETNENIGAYAEAPQTVIVQDGIIVIHALRIVAVLILVLASINVGNLLLGRAIERRKETAIRVALGAPRSRLVAQMLWESVLICTLGGVIGLLLVAWGLEATEQATASFFPGNLPFWFTFGVDGYTLALFFAVLVTTVLVTGLLPAWRNSGSDFNAVLRDGTRSATSKKSGRLNAMLVISEVFISVAVLIAAIVMAIAAYSVTHADYGADTRDKLTARVFLSGDRYDETAAQASFLQGLQARLAGRNGVSEAVLASAIPGEPAPTEAVAVEGRDYRSEAGDAYPRANVVSVTPGGLGVLGLELQAGRFFGAGEENATARTAIVTQSFVDRYFDGDDPLGARIRVVEGDADAEDWATVVGVVEHAVFGQPGGEIGRRATVFRPMAQAPMREISVALALTTNAADGERVLRSTLAALDPDLPAYEVSSYDEKLRLNGGPLRFISRIFLIFGIAASILAASGIYGVMATTISQRTQEIGVKRALGAWDGRIRVEFLMSALKKLLIGGVPGLLLGVALGFGMSQVFGLESTLLPIVAAGVVTLIAAVLIVATAVPTARALRLEPNQALRYE